MFETVCECTVVVNDAGSYFICVTYLVLSALAAKVLDGSSITS